MSTEGSRGSRGAGPVRVAVVDDYEVVVRGLATMLQRFRERVEVVAVDPEIGLDQNVDLVLYDHFGHVSSGGERIRELLGSSFVHRVVVYTWNTQPALVGATLEQGAAGYLSKTLSAAHLVDALERVHAGESVVSESVGGSHQARDWVGREQGLSPRESEMLTLISQGMTNDQIAEQSHVSINSVKSYIRAAYRKIGARSRSQAVLWGVRQGLEPAGQPPASAATAVGAAAPPVATSPITPLADQASHTDRRTGSSIRARRAARRDGGATAS